MKLQYIILVIIVILGFFLRFIDVSNDPPGLYIDEASIGYNAYTILTTGKDEYGIPHPLWFRSFGDYKMPVYIYSVSGAMALFGKTVFAVRIPSIITGTLTIIVLYLFLNELLSMEKDNKLQKKLKYLPILASFLLAISSWHIQFSRGGFEITMGSFFYLLAGYLYLLYIHKKSHKTITASILLFILSMYTYDTFRVLAPLALIFIAYNQKIYKNPKSIPYVILAGILILPIFLFTFTSQGSERLGATNAFGELHVQGIAMQMAIYPLDYFRNYLSFFSLDFLFNYGDGIGRHQIPNFGELYRWQLPFFLSGIYILLRQKKSLIKNTVLLLFFTTPLAGALAVPSPHALRSLPLVFPCIIFISVGILFFIEYIRNFKLKILTVVIILLISGYEFFLYLHFYYIHYPLVNQLDWGGGYKQVVLKTGEEKNSYKHIIIDDYLTFAPVYFHFYDPSIKFTVVPPGWKEPKSWNNSKTLFIRPYYGANQGKNLIANIYLNGRNNEIFAQLWEIN
jgi:4-amino-4-deoxy-L-arabinose transferase-like glycosyltransferase